MNIVRSTWMLGCVALAFCGSPSVAEDRDAAEMWSVIQQQQAVIEQLQRQLIETNRILSDIGQRIGLTEQQIEVTEDTVNETNQKIEATASMVDEILMGSGDQGSKPSFGGYGEVHYNNTDKGDAVDLHRYVLFVGYQFSDRLNFFSEFEIEHAIAGEGKVGEVEVEQAYLQWDYADNHHMKFGVTLVPTGILNETHEPDTFYGVERNSVEKEIIPATWWEAGVAIGGELAPGWQYDMAVHSGLNLDADNGSASKRTSVRSARQKAGKANASDLAMTGRLRYSGIAGVNLGLTIQYQSDVTQGDDDGVGVDDISGLLMETDLVWQRDNFTLKALYARWDFDDRMNLLNPGADEQSGWLIEPSYRLSDRLGMFARYSSYNVTANSVADNDVTQMDLGLNYWLNPRFVLKADYQRQRKDAGNDVDGFNLGIGYSF